MRTFDKKQITQFGLALRYPYVTNPAIAFLLLQGMTIQHIHRASGIDRRTLLKYQLNTRKPTPKHTKALANCVMTIVAAAREAKKITRHTKQSDLYHDHLDTLIAWGEYLAYRERRPK